MTFPDTVEINAAENGRPFDTPGHPVTNTNTCSGYFTASTPERLVQPL